jgi:peroxiredoxin
MQIMLKPRAPVPALNVSLVGGGSWDGSQVKSEKFTMVVFYRGLHCPICRAYLTELNRLASEFAQRGVEVVAISSDSAERAEQAKRDWTLPNLKIGYGLSEASARAWGLYISTSRGTTSIGIDEPARFSEPGLFLVKPDGTLYHGAVQTMPFARPHFDEMLKAIDFAVAKDYPARGEA